MIHALPTPQPDPDVLTYLAQALEDAKAGKLTGVLLVTQQQDGAAQYSIAGIKDRFTVLGYLTHALYKLQQP